MEGRGRCKTGRERGKRSISVIERGGRDGGREKKR